MSWLQLNVTVTNGSKTVTVHNGASTAKIRAGDALVMPGFSPVEIAGVFATTLQLANAWSSATQNTAACAIMPTFGDFDSAAATMRQFTQTAQGNFAAMEKWRTEQGQVEFKGFDNEVHQVRTAKQMDDDVKAIEQVAKDTITEVDTFGVVMTEAQAMAIREQNRRKFAASDFVYHGRHADSAANGYFPINEGLWSLTGIPNTLWMGRGASNQYYGGKSKSDFPLFNIDGITAPLVTHPTAPQFEMLLPETPNGTVTYDSATGVVTDFTTEVDPKYGDVAGTVNEAVSRAFEGEVSNGDFRFGDDGSWSVTLSSVATYGTNEVILTPSSSTYNSGLEQTLATTLDAATEYLLEAEVEVTEAIGPGGIFSMRVYDSFSDATAFITYDFPSRGVGVYKVRVKGTTGSPVSSNRIKLWLGGLSGEAVLRNVSLSKVTKRVVTERVDMTALEFWPELITDDEVFPHCIQNQSTTFGDTGIPTVVSDRPESYFQVFEGQTGIQKGRCVKWSTLTSAQKHEVAAYLGESFYKTNGGLVQWRSRNRSFAGAGNGDWLNVYPNNISSHTLRFSNNNFIEAQGANDIQKDYTSAWSSGTLFNRHTGEVLPNYEKGVFATRTNFADSYSGECYIYVIATVPRLNQGAYHPSLNPFGTARWCRTSTVSNNGEYWDRDLAIAPNSVKDAFIKLDDTVNTTIPAATSASGAIGQLSGHPDDLYYDAIYSSGVGGVIDHRLEFGAWDASNKGALSSMRESLKGDSYRGRQKLVRTHVDVAEAYTSLGSSSYWQGGEGSVGTFSNFLDVAVGDLISVVDTSNTLLVSKAIITSVSSSGIGWDDGQTYNRVSGSTYYAILEKNTNVSVEGTFLQNDVIATPTEVVENATLLKGWLGGICLPFPDGITDEFELSRKYISGMSSDSITTVQRTNDNGSSWLNFVTYPLTDDINTVRSVNHPDTGLTIVQYYAEAKRTEESTRRELFKGLDGLSNFIFASSYYPADTGVLLAESTLGVITKNSQSGVRLQEASLTSIGLLSSGLLNEYPGSASFGPISHTALSLDAPNNNSSAVKYLFHLCEINEQLHMAVIANELIYDEIVGNWGDSGEIKVINGTFTDLNGNSCRASINLTSKPFGWVRNEI